MKNLIKIFVVLFVTVAFAQTDDRTNFAVSVVQDGRLLFAGDGNDNDAGTINLMVNIELRTNVKGEGLFQGYTVFMPTVEYADLTGGQYLRYGVNGGYTFTNWFEITKNIPIDINLYGGVGFISRRFSYTTGENTFFPSFSLGGDATILLFKNLGVVLAVQLTDRKDLKMAYNDMVYFKVNVYGGLKFNF